MSGASETGHLSPTSNLSQARVTATGASTARALKDRFADELSVLDFIPQALHVAIRAGTSTDDVSEYVQAAVTAAAATRGGVYFPDGAYCIDPATSLSVPSWVTLRGAGRGARLYKLNSGITAPILLLDASGDVLIQDLALDMSDATAAYGCIEVDGAAARVKIERVLAHSAYSGVWVKQGTSVTIERSTIYGCTHNVYLGGNALDMGGVVERVRVEGCELYDARAGGDGIKTVKLVKRLDVVGCDIYGNGNDAIDLFAGAERVLIAHNRLHDNDIQGIDIKSDEANYPVADWGYRRHIKIIGNEIYGNGENGVKIWKTVDGDWPHSIAVVENDIHGNQMRGVVTRAPNCRISGNEVYGNGLSDGAAYQGIYLFGSATEPVINAVVSENHVFNNGCPTEINVGITLGDVADSVVSGNVVDSVSWLDNDEQDQGIAVGSTCTGIKLIGNVCGSGLTTPITVAAGASYFAAGNTPSTEDNVNGILVGSAQNVGTLAANTVSADITISVPGARTGGRVIVGLPSNSPAGIIAHGAVTADDTVKLRVANVSNGSVNVINGVYNVQVYNLPS